MSVDCAAWDVIAWAAAEGFLADLALLVADFLMGIVLLGGMTMLELLVLCMTLEFCFNFTPPGGGSAPP